MKLTQCFLALFFLNIIFTEVSFADELSLQEAVLNLQERVSALEKKITEQDGYIESQNAIMQAQQQKITEYESKLSQFDEKLHREIGRPIQLVEGLEIGVGGTMVIQGTNNVNNATSDVQKKVSRTDASYSADITIGKEFKDVGGKALLHLEAGQGAGLEDNLTLYSNVNRDADNDNNVRLTEFWYEQALLKDKVALTFGKLDPTAYFDQNEVANDETTEFLGRIFRNSPTIEFPDNGAGIRVAYIPKEWIELGYGLFNAKSSWEKIGDNLFNIGQVHFKTNFFNLAGNYRFLGWYNNAYHTKWLDESKQKEGVYGFGLSFDQKVTDITTAFLRYGWQGPKVYNPDIKATGDLTYSLEHSWSAGLQVEGKPWGREKDVLAFAVGQVFPSDDYKKADSARRAKAEGHLESYYRIFINDHLSISPDFQYIWNPFGKDVADDTSDIFVGGIRAQVDF
ncbi:MAG: carbohydrate porin [Candidatus Omnitrophica bacterium]|nr:carbohydrate porin [Candidatus Omnitrophota bacterium]MCG2707032.1 carbohydrate porin [Candidatus Omnitrophota bacterium]